MENKDVVWEGKVGGTSLRVGVPHSDAIIAEWDTPRGQRHKVSDSVEEFERSVLFQILLTGEAENDDATAEIVTAVAKAQAERPKRMPEGGAQRRRKSPRARRHRRSRTPPRRR